MPRLRIVPGRSHLTIEARSSIHSIHGRASSLGGYIDAPFESLARNRKTPATARLEVPLSALRSGNPLYDREMVRRADARRFPVIVGELREIVALGDDRYRLAGELTFHGVTREVEGDVTARIEDGQLDMEGEHVFDTRDFNMDPPRILMLKVHPHVTVRLHLVAVIETGND